MNRMIRKTLLAAFAAPALLLAAGQAAAAQQYLLCDHGVAQIWETVYDSFGHPHLVNTGQTAGGCYGHWWVQLSLVAPSEPEKPPVEPGRKTVTALLQDLRAVPADQRDSEDGKRAGAALLARIQKEAPRVVQVDPAALPAQARKALQSPQATPGPRPEAAPPVKEAGSRRR